MFAVFLDELTLTADDVVAVYAAAGFRTALDARAAAARAAGGVLVDDADADAAARLKDALAHRGFGASVVAAKDLALPVAQRTKEVVVKDGALDVADSLGRLVPLPLDEVLLLAAARTRVVTTEPAKNTAKGASGLGKMGSVAMSMALPGAQTAAKMIKAAGGAGSGVPSTAMVEREETFLEIVTAAKRLRLDQSGLVVRAGGPRSLVELAAALAQRAAPSTTQQRGFRALVAGGEPPALKSLRELDREISWCLWRRAR